MKYYNRLLLMAATVMMVSCADIEFADYTVEKPENWQSMNISMHMMH